MNGRYLSQYIPIGFIIVICSLQSGCHARADLQRRPAASETVYEVNAVKTEIPKGALSFEYSGVAVPRQTTEISFQLAGEVERVLVEEGDAVRKGQKLAVIDKSRFLSSYNAASAMKRQADDAYDRLKQVYDKGSLPEIKWQEVITKQQQAQASTQIAKENLKDCVLTAPSDGIVATKRIEKGTNVTPNITVMEVMQLDTVYIRISVPENEISYLKTGQQGLVTIAAIGSKVFMAEVSQIGVAASPVSKTYEVKLQVKNTDLVIKPGMAAIVKLEIEQQQHLPVVPLRAVQQDRFGKKFLYIIDEKNRRTIRKDVQLGRFYKNDVYVTQGILGGELVVVDGQHKLSPNAEIAFRLLK